MITIGIIALLIAAISVYDYYTTRTWQQVTSNIRNETVFEHRNKQYGAYVMRRDYSKTIVYSIAGLLVLTGGVGFTALGRSAVEEKMVTIEDSGFKTIEYEIKFEKKEESQQQKKQQQIVETKKFIEPIASEEAVKTEVKPIEGDQIVGTTDQQGEGNQIGTITDGSPGGSGTETPPEPVETEKEDPFFPATAAEFPGGMPALMKFLQNELTMPPIAIELGLKGKSYIQFVVDKDGSISDINLKRGMLDCAECDKEAIRVIRIMPKWIPARNERNKPMRSVFNIPIGFDASH